MTSSTPAQVWKDISPEMLEALADHLHPVRPSLSQKHRPLSDRETRFDSLLLEGGDFEGSVGLETAFQSFTSLIGNWASAGKEPARLQLRRNASLGHEEHWIAVAHSGVTLEASDEEGIRRGLVWLEDEMLKRSGAILPIGQHRRRPVITTRLSRCFFGPIQRPPLHRHELNDDVDYYPEPYLDRLAHDGVTGLWITLKFKDSLPSRLFPEYGQHAEKHLGKLRRTVERCARYGIRIYVFCIEPAALPLDSPILKRHPELRGHVRNDLAAFCPSGEIGQAYLEEAGRTLLQEVPGLGGMVAIPVGERFTHCASTGLPREGRPYPANNCPRCQHRAPHEVLYDTLAGLRRGMDEINPDAELISWPYGQSILWGDEKTIESAGHVPKGVILQHNFESGGIHHQLGKERPLWDYWLSWAGPSPVFEAAASRQIARAGRVSAKLQVGNSHEIATVPFIPVPGLLYRKYQAMHRIGVTSAMQSWYFGNYPSLMTRAAGLLSFAPLPRSERAFLIDLARRDWGDQAETIAQAWALFGRGYENYPATHFFGYYGPMQDGSAWPLHLIPRNRPLAPTWRIDFPLSGDYLADALSSYFTLPEVLTLSGRMVRSWKKGMDLFGKAFEASEKTALQWHQKRVAEAITLQFETGLAILQFYSLREKLVDCRQPRQRLRLLDQMEALVVEELKRRRRLIPLLEEEPILGFHSEAEGYKVTPELVRNSLQLLAELLEKEFPTIRQAALEAGSWFQEYTGETSDFLPLAPLAAAPWHPNKTLKPLPQTWNPVPRHSLMHWLMQPRFEGIKNTYGGEWEALSHGPAPVESSFQTAYHDGKLLFLVDFAVPEGSTFGLAGDEWKPTLILEIEPARLRPRIQFSINHQGFTQSLLDEGYLTKRQPPFQASWTPRRDGWTAALSIPKSSLLLEENAPFRLLLRLYLFHQETSEQCELSWTKREPLPARLAWGDVNPATDYSWAKIISPDEEH